MQLANRMTGLRSQRNVESRETQNLLSGTDESVSGKQDLKTTH